MQSSSSPVPAPTPVPAPVPAPVPTSDAPNKPPRRLPLCNDVVFKALFAQHLPLLTDLINAVLYPAPPITVQRVLNPHILPAEVSGKSIVLDILAEDTQGQRLGVEMQLRHYLHWPQRNIYGVARTLASQLQVGQDYQQLKPAISISLLAHDLFDKYPNQACWRFTLRDQRRPKVQLDSVLQVHIIELSKAERLGRLPTALRAWIACLLHNLDDTAMNAITYPPVKEALQHLEAMYSDEELRLIAERRELALIDDQNAIAWALHEGEKIGLQKGEQAGLERGERIGLQKGIQQGIQQGMQQGLQQGIQQGIQQGTQKGIQQGIQQGLQQQQQTLLSMLEHKFGTLAPSFQARLEHADAQQLQVWSLSLLDARRIEDVFV